MRAACRLTITQSVFCLAARREDVGTWRDGHRRDGGLKTCWTKPRPRRGAMGIESRRVSRRTWDERRGGCHGGGCRRAEPAAGMREVATGVAGAVFRRWDEGWRRHVSRHATRAQDPRRATRARAGHEVSGRTGRGRAAQPRQRHDHVPIRTDGTGAQRDAGERLVAVAIVRWWPGSPVIGGAAVVPRSCRHRASLSVRWRWPSKP